MQLKKIADYVWELPKQGKMLVPGRIYGDEKTVEHLYMEEQRGGWSAIKQLANVASLPGIQKYALALADIHPGYGSPIGGVFAMDYEEGVITFGGVGFDINCGVRTMKTPLKLEEVEKIKEKLAEELFRKVPAGLGSTGELKLNLEEIDEVLAKGAHYVVEHGYGFKEDLEYIEEKGRIEGALPEAVSIRAKQRQFKQIGTLGSGNHYLEVQYVEQIFDEEAAKNYGIEKEQILISFHCGSRGLGHQIGMDYLKELDAARKKYNIEIPDRELVCAPIQSEEGQRYFGAVKAGINCAFANRQVIAHLAREAFCEVIGIAAKEIKTLYEVGHNTAKEERHKINGEVKRLLVQRKGSTRGFGPHQEEIPEEYRKIGQPVLVGGTMGTYSYILRGTEKAMEETFGSTIHGAGRRMSRVRALKQWRGEILAKELRSKGIIVKAHSWRGLAEEAPGAYKDIDEVVNVMHNAGITLKVARVRPIICVKG
ncbi:MAG: RtcB family protein [Candidatus Diapherotrites archaeon]|nr:RtcB family protein [Candidatus Diapherotrites archaeon]